MKVYWDTEYPSFIIENENGKRMRVTSSTVQLNPTADHIIMKDAVLVHEVDLLDTINVGDKVNPAEVEREGVVLRLIGTDCFIVYCENHWRSANGNGIGFKVTEAVLHSKMDNAYYRAVRERLIGF